MNNSRWKTIQSFEDLERFLRNNPTLRVYDTHDRECRYVIRRTANDQLIVASVDGRSFHALVMRMKKSADGGFQFEGKETNESPTI